MKKIVRFLMSVASGLDVGLQTYEQLSQPAPQVAVKEKNRVGFSAGEASPTANFVNPPPSPWVNKENQK